MRINASIVSNIYAENVSKPNLSINDVSPVKNKYFYAQPDIPGVSEVQKEFSLRQSNILVPTARKKKSCLTKEKLVIVLT